ncbi:MAG TPA: PH domain-containing protein [Candidatus Saccharimonadales bacterium]|nr:PH domain-containing protein [Candidatus Saccharimonadales bacterium]
MDPQNPQPQPNPTPQPWQPPAPGQEPQDSAYKGEYERPKEPGVHPMVVLQQGEQIVANVKRHPFGIIQLYVAAVIGIAIAAVVAFLLLPSLLGQYNNGNGMAIVVGGLVLVVALLVLILGVATSVYWQNEWVITTDSITQIVQSSLFNRQVSQLSMENLEDVTVNQDGIIPHMFNFGTLKVETAGERSKFIFPYCPNPNEYARKILEIHEHFLEERRNVQNTGGAATITTNNPPLKP